MAMSDQPTTKQLKAQAKAHYQEAVRWYSTLRTNLNEILRTKDKSTFKTIKEELDNQYKNQVAPLLNISKDPIAVGRGDSDLEKWSKEAQKKYEELYKLTEDINKT